MLMDMRLCFKRQFTKKRNLKKIQNEKSIKDCHRLIAYEKVNFKIKIKKIDSSYFLDIVNRKFEGNFSCI